MIEMQCCARCGRWTEAEVDLYKIGIGVCGWKGTLTFGTDYCKLYNGDKALPKNTEGRILNAE